MRVLPPRLPFLPPQRPHVSTRRAIATLSVAAILGGGGLALGGLASAETVEPSLTWTGPLGSATGEAVSQSSCDVDGNGRQDVVTSAWMWERAPYGSIGASYVIFDDARPGELDDPSSGVMRIEGPQSKSPLTGFSVSCAGDVNADGYDDVLVTEYINSRVYVVFGSEDRSNLSLQYLGDRGFVIQSPDNDRTGYQATGVGDLDGDGFDDVAVTSLTANGRAGKITVVKGRDDIATVRLDDPSQGSPSSTAPRGSRSPPLLPPETSTATGSRTSSSAATWRCHGD